MSNFGSILDKAPTVVERPKTLPQGTYLCVVSALPTYGKSSKKQTDYVEFLLKPIAAGEDVDEEALKAWMTKADGSTRTLDSARIKNTIYLTEDSVYRLDDFHTHCGLELIDGVSRRQRNEQVVNAEVIAFVGHRAGDDGEGTFADLKKTAKPQ